MSHCWPFTSHGKVRAGPCGERSSAAHAWGGAGQRRAGNACLPPRTPSAQYLRQSHGHRILLGHIEHPHCRCCQSKGHTRPRSGTATAMRQTGNAKKKKREWKKISRASVTHERTQPEPRGCILNSRAGSNARTLRLAPPCLSAINHGLCAECHEKRALCTSAGGTRSARAGACAGGAHGDACRAQGAAQRRAASRCKGGTCFPRDHAAYTLRMCVICCGALLHRRTGVVPKDSVRRDALGFEDVDDFWDEGALLRPAVAAGCNVAKVLIQASHRRSSGDGGCRQARDHG